MATSSCILVNFEANLYFRENLVSKYPAFYETPMSVVIFAYDRGPRTTEKNQRKYV